MLAFTGVWGIMEVTQVKILPIKYSKSRSHQICTLSNIEKIYGQKKVIRPLAII